MKKVIVSGIVLLALGAGVWFYLYWTSDRRRVTVLVEKLPSLIRKTAGAAPHDGVLRYAAVDKIFTDPVRISAAYRGTVLDRSLTRGETRSLLALFHRQVQSAGMRLAALEVEISGAEARFACDAEFTAALSGQTDTQVMRITGTAVRRDGRWRIAAVTAAPLVER